LGSLQRVHLDSLTALRGGFEREKGRKLGEGMGLDKQGRGKRKKENT